MSNRSCNATNKSSSPLAPVFRIAMPTVDVRHEGMQQLIVLISHDFVEFTGYIAHYLGMFSC